MSRKSFFIAGGSAGIVANDVNDFRYLAALKVLPPGEQAPAQTNERLETHILVEQGSVEFMVGGGTAVAFAGDFVRVPVGVIYAGRNVGDIPARLLVRHVSPAATIRAAHVRIDYAA